jgi:hypothetical protein
VAQKLLIKPGNAVWVSDPARAGLIGPLPEGVIAAARLVDADVAVVLVDDEAGLRAFDDHHREVLGAPGRCGCSTPRAIGSR